MTAHGDRRGASERRLLLDRRMGAERGEAGPEERRQNDERRSGLERRLSLQSAGDQIREALRLLTRVVESGDVAEQEIRRLDGAILRLRVALDQLEDD